MIKAMPSFYDLFPSMVFIISNFELINWDNLCSPQAIGWCLDCLVPLNPILMLVCTVRTLENGNGYTCNTGGSLSNPHHLQTGDIVILKFDGPKRSLLAHIARLNTIISIINIGQNVVRCRPIQT